VVRVADATFRLRVIYGKTGRLRFLSHLEVAHACERAIRRVDLQYAVTQGFNPHMRIAFGPALPVGTAGVAEAYEVWLTRLCPVREVLEALKAASPEGLAPTEVRYVSEREPSLAAAMTLGEYEVVVEDPDMGPGRFAEALGDVIGSGSLMIERKGVEKVYDLAACLPEGARVDEEPGRSVVRMTVRMGAYGSLRPEALVGEALGRIDARDASMAVTRVALRPEVAAPRV
jgi:radical SAM-linked protein